MSQIGEAGPESATQAADLKAGVRHGLGFWAVAYTFVVLLAFSTVPSPLYILYAHRDHFSSFMITVIYATYAIGVIASLFLASHLSDVHGRRPHLLAAVALAIVSDVVFLAWPSLAGLFAGRILCGLSVGLAVSTATAWINELYRVRNPRSSGARSQFTATAANLGGLGLGALAAGLLAQFAGGPLTVPYLVFLGLLLVAGFVTALSPETRQHAGGLPAYRPQRITVPGHARPRFFAALLGAFLAFAVLGMFIGLAGTFLATAVHQTSLALSGETVFIVFGVGVVLLAVTSTWTAQRLITVGVPLTIAGLVLTVLAAWLPSPSLTVFLAGGALIGAGGSAIFKGTIGTVAAIAPVNTLGEALAGLFLAGYAGLSLPVVAIGVALEFLTTRATLLAVAVVVAAGILAAARRLAERTSRPDSSGTR
jgi:predicted MFS family arabinose efflux permease